MTLQCIAHPRTSRIVNRDELARYKLSGTYRTAKRRKARRDLVSDMFGFMAIVGAGLALNVALAALGAS